VLTLVLATKNPGKVREFQRLLGGEFVVLPLDPGVDLPEETGVTFAENALLKARAAFAALGGRTAVLADDSGLAVDALDGRPGVRSARYAGEGARDEENTRLVLTELAALGPGAGRGGQFVCALALVAPAADGEPALVVATEGILSGQLTLEPRGSGGFGYDPVFRPAGWDRTLAEVGGAEKDAVSHRAAAVAALRRRLAREGVVAAAAVEVAS
jgi:XTP/dITP diphosphohydrolase